MFWINDLSLAYQEDDLSPSSPETAVKELRKPEHADGISQRMSRALEA
jgi:hypothetical protein